jgi:iron complex outermembrane receptor protein
MTKVGIGYWLGGLSAMALMTGVAPAQTATSAPAANEEQGPSDIIVTARRVNETLNEVPASVTAFGAEAIANANIQRASDFAQLTPGVTIVSSTAEAGDTQINIRGLNGARDAESSVALVVDGILKTNTAALDQNQGTIRQIEVLKGPQGALYGRNAAAGAIVIQTLKPGDKLEGGIRLSYANNNTFDGDAYISTPLGEGAGLVVSGNYYRTDGFFRNVFLSDHKTVDDRESWNINGRFVADLADKTKLDVKARYGELHGASIAFNAAFHLPNFAAVNPAFYENVNAHPFRFYSNIRPTNDQETFEASAKLDHDLGPATLSAWVAYSDIKNDLTADGTSADFARYIAATNPAAQSTVTSCFASTAALTGFPSNPPTFIGQIPVPFIFAPANGSTFGPYSATTCDGTQYQVRNQKDVSTEIRLASNGDNRLDWQLGAYYLHIKRTVGVSLGGDSGQGIIKNLYNPPNSANPTSQLFADRFNTNVYAVFGSVDFEATDKFDIGLALRYDVEERRDTNLVPIATDPFTGGPINPGQAFGPIAPQKQTYKQVEPKVTLRYEIAPQNNIFANWGVGFKSGGFNNQGSAAIVNANFNQFLALNPPVTIKDNYRKERSSAFEAGVKGRVGPVNYSLAGYYTRVRDMQFFEFFVGSFGLLRVVSNIDRVDLKGVEFNLDTRLTRWWQVFGSVNYTDSKIKKNSSRPDTVGNKSPYTADYTLNLGTQFNAPLANRLELFGRVDYRLTGPTWFHTVQNQEKATLFSGLLPISPLALPAVVGNARYDVNRRNSFSVVDARLGLNYDQWRISAFANNVFNKKYLAEVIPAIEFGGSFISPGARRLYGVEVGYKF